jgi:peptidoglycan/LPS O-acetylase OafA/YrhL
MVMVLHFAWAGTSSNDKVIFSLIWPVVHHGYLGVQLFFVISGYCITAAMHAGLNKPKAVRTFLQRRARRILPPYWASMIFVVLTGMITITLLKTSPKIVFPLEPWEWLCNIFLIQGPLGANDANMVYWSLSIEAQFYLVMATCMALGSRYCEFGLIIATILTVCFHLLLNYSSSGTIIAYWTQFACGIYLFYIFTNANKYSFTPIVLLLLIMLDSFGDYYKYRVLYYTDRGHVSQALKILFCLSLVPVMFYGQRIETRISNDTIYRVLAWFGCISYSLYLTHYIIGTRVINLGSRVTGLDGLKWIPYFFLCMIISTIGGYIFYILCEKPWLNTKQNNNPDFTNRVHNFNSEHVKAP